MAERGCERCGGEVRNGYCLACGAAVSRSGDARGTWAALTAPFRALWTSLGYLPRPGRLADAVRSGTLRLADCLAGYLAWAAIAFLLLEILPPVSDTGPNMLSAVREGGGGLPLVGEIVQFGIWAVVFLVGFVPLHLILKIWKGPTAHVGDAFAIYLLYGGPFVVLRTAAGSWIAFAAGIALWTVMLTALARLYRVNPAVTIGWYLLIWGAALLLLGPRLMAG